MNSNQTLRARIVAVFALLAAPAAMAAVITAVPPAEYRGSGVARAEAVIFAAPDVDARIFRREILPRLAPHAEHITLYASSDDDALRASRMVNNAVRLGLGGDSLVVIDGMDTVDASRVTADLLGHTLFGNTSFIADLAVLLAEGKSPAERRLLAATKDGKTYYRFRGDRR